MKKILSMVLVAAMLLSVVFVIAAVPAAAVDGNWNTYGLASESGDDYAGEKKSVPGYTYTADGIKDCSRCLRPHRRENYDDMCRAMAKVMELAKKP